MVSHYKSFTWSFRDAIFVSHFKLDLLRSHSFNEVKDLDLLLKYAEELIAFPTCK